jgi:glycosyltransferase involved in cell wall biosynthesis
VHPLCVLYIHATGPFGGASKSLCELIRAFPQGTVRPIVLCPRGTAAEHFARAGARVITARGISKWDHTRFSFYRGLRWLLLLRELLYALPTTLALRRIRAQNLGIDLVHANDVTALAPGVLASRMLGVPLVTHVRSLQNADPRLWRTRAQNRAIARHAARVIAIDETVRRTLPASLKVDVIHNGIRVRSADSGEDSPRPFRVAMVGLLLRLKGVFEFLEAARLCRERGVRAEFWIAGENAREVKGLRGRLLAHFGFSEDVRTQLEAGIARHGLGESVKLLGFVADVERIYRSIDVLCFPSHLDAAGRPVFEAGWFGVPSIVAARDPLPDTLADGESGLCIPEPNAASLADAIERLYRDRALATRLGQGARRLAETYFDQDRNSATMLSLYREVCGTLEHDMHRKAVSQVEI